MTSEVVYTGSLRTRATHLRSGAGIVTDAPVDNHGKGEHFSPTDLVATALGSCMLTVMGIASEQQGIDISGTQINIQKVMAEGPRRITAVLATVTMPAGQYPDKIKNLLEHTARNCPVAKSLHPDIRQEIAFIYPAG